MTVLGWRPSDVSFSFNDILRIQFAGLWSNFIEASLFSMIVGNCSWRFDTAFSGDNCMEDFDYIQSQTIKIGILPLFSE